MNKSFYLIESSRWSNDGSINPCVHAVVYATRDTLIVKVLDFLNNHMRYLADTDCESLNAAYLTEPIVDARIVAVLRKLCDFESSDISFDCPEWQTSYRIRVISVTENQWRSLRILNNQKVVLGVEFGSCEDGHSCDFVTNSPEVRPEHRLAEDCKKNNPQYDEMKLTLNEFSIEGLEW